MTDNPASRMKTHDYDLGPYTFPRGWFMVAAAADLVVKKPVPVRYFGKDFIIYRGESGRVVMVDAYCAHMQTHLCKNTTSYIMQDDKNIEGDSIRCPYHAWRFGPDGKCDDIPYFDGPIPEKAKIGSYPVVEKYGIIYMWHDPEGGEPAFELPDLPMWDNPAWVKWRIDDLGVIATHPVEVLDNMQDMPHVWPTHGGTLDYFRNEYQAHINVQYQGGHHRMPELANTRMDLVTWYTGPGLLLSRMCANFESLQFINNTPVEDGITKVWTGVLVNTGNPNPTPEDLANCVIYQDANLNAFAQDFEIWANKAPCKQILQIPTDGPFGHGRRWYSQFYRPLSESAAIHAKTDGVVFTKGMNPIVPQARTLALGDVAPFTLWHPEGPEFEKKKAPEPAE